VRKKKKDRNMWCYKEVSQKKEQVKNIHTHTTYMYKEGNERTQGRTRERMEEKGGDE
jgi:hypothetical protein